MFNIELLAPAGDMDSLIAAVENGADAVYLGGKNFSARQYAGNFDEDEITRAVEYCHTRDVKVYVTLNILLKDPELQGLPEYVSFLYNTGVDALIIQDLGVGKLIRDMISEFEIHASTQMTAHNLESVNFLYNSGYKRVVLSRELSLEEIKHITQNTEAEIEVFTHGALCICYSGQCLMSSVIGGRSGNRGRCAQPCRQRYQLSSSGDNFSSYVLSPKDLCTIECMDQLLESGIKSLKVEGRMKRPEYVAAVISVYRKSIDSYNSSGSVNVTEEDMMNLMQVFNRGGFTTAHLFEKGRGEMMSFERPKNWGLFIGKVAGISNDGMLEIELEERLAVGDGIEIWTGYGENTGYTIESIIKNDKTVEKGLKGDTIKLKYKGGKKGDKVYKTFDSELMKKLEGTYKGADFLRKIPVDFFITIGRGEPIAVKASDIDGNTALAKGQMPEEALKVPVTKKKAEEQVSKLGGTPFRINSIAVDLDPGLSVSAGTLNSLRREAVDRLIKSRLDKFKRGQVEYNQMTSKMGEILAKRIRKSSKEARVSVMLKDSGSVDSALRAGADLIIFGGDRLRGYDFDYRNAIEMCRDYGVEIYLASPRIIKDEFDKIMRDLEDGMDCGADGIYAENLGVVEEAIKRGIPFSAGFSLNVFNTISAGMFNELGSRFISISPELSLKDIKGSAPFIENCEALCYGRIEMMVSEYCPIGSTHGCTGGDKRFLCEKGDASITDRMGMAFPVKTDIYCRSHIYNSRILSILENLNSVVSSGVDILRLNMTLEDDQEIYEIVKAFKEYAQSINNGEYDMTEYGLKVKDYIESKGSTKGHYYRGVE